MKRTLLLVITSAALLGHTTTPPAKHPDPASLLTAGLLSEPGPTFRINDNQLPTPLTLITYGDYEVYRSGEHKTERAKGSALAGEADRRRTPGCGDSERRRPACGRRKE